MKQMLSFGMAAALLATACFANAYPTFNGLTGTATLPTAATVAPEQFNAAVDLIDEPGDTAYAARLLYGFKANVEGALAFQTNLDGDDALGVAGKWVSPATLADFNLAVAADLFDNGDDFSLDIYGIGTRKFSDVFTGSVGLWLNRGDEPFSDDRTTTVRPYFSAQYTFANGASLNGELVLKRDNEEEFGRSINLRYPASDTIGVQLGLLQDDMLFFGANYAFGGE